ncbi:UDP-N-acetylmuramoyl-L-alanyl-D-glutamate--2,6-diaminopimelate ligase [Synergistaceae bacterium OttesenSCG-928-I11]|nr:UDP-N-acetylmuramoyl-L-alanyl-D-glutamate--2,6-diaminopimelate ligase [Synergistaceae bacterium OttesenSCG-928-I11]
MKLDELLKKIRVLDDRELALENDGGKNPELSRVVYDNRKIAAGSRGVVFACVKGERADGHAFAPRAVENGAEALLCERKLDLDVPQLIVQNVRSYMGALASALHGSPSEKMTMIAVTGTNGKTTTAYITRSILRASGAVAGMLGTIVYDDARSEAYADRTTPEGPDVQDALARMVENGAAYCVMEASSHGLHQGRLKGCRFDRMGFSNLTPEHLEYHIDMENYYRAKRLLFTDYAKEGWQCAVNVDDAYGRRLFDEFSARMRGFSLGDARENLYTAKVLGMDVTGTTMDVSFADGAMLRLKAPFIGDYNASNVLEALAIADSLGIDREVVRNGIEHCPQVPGRLERYTMGNGVTVFVDYAHSSDGVEKILTALRPLTQGKLSILWGAGGDRTPTKRPVVGEIMARYADFTVVTTDNPRSERPEDIARGVESGITGFRKDAAYRVILDRREAICFALDRAESGDVVIVAGKGPERTIEYATHSVPFSDNDTVLEWARERGIEVV